MTYTAVCKKACTFRGQYWQVGRVYRGMKEPPRHFEITETDESAEDPISAPEKTESSPFPKGKRVKV